MHNIIVVGVDGSETATKAADAAARLAHAMGALLHIVSAYEDGEVESVGVGSDRYAVSSADRAEGCAKSAAESVVRRGLEITTEAANGKPADVLIEVAKRLDASVIVVGNRRMHGVGRILGSIANSVAHHAPCDIYIVKTT